MTHRVLVLKADSLATGMAMTVPLSLLRSRALNRARMISTENHSSPWSMEVINRVGPGSRPVSTWAVMFTSTPRSLVTGTVMI